MKPKLNLPPNERPRALYEYYVHGTGPFPLDMLRYDACWPFEPNDVPKILNPVFRSIKLRSFREPDLPRWRSRGWEVSNERLDA